MLKYLQQSWHKQSPFSLCKNICNFPSGTIKFYFLCQSSWLLKGHIFIFLAVILHKFTNIPDHVTVFMIFKLDSDKYEKYKTSQDRKKKEFSRLIIIFINLRRDPAVRNAWPSSITESGEKERSAKVLHLDTMWKPEPGGDARVKNSCSRAEVNAAVQVGLINRIVVDTPWSCFIFLSWSYAASRRLIIWEKCVKGR